MSGLDQRSRAADIRAVPSAAAAPIRIAYLTNVYPKPSHTFIRTEILALEKQRFAVERFSIRRSDATLLDRLDREEEVATRTLLEGAKWRLLAAAAGAFVRAPLRWAATLRLALAEGWRTSGVVSSAAYFLEACALARAMRRAGIDHVHVHFGTNPATVARLARRLAGIGYSITVHGPDEFDAPVALRLREKVADARFVVAISDHGRAQLMRWSAAQDWPRIHVVRCGVPDEFLLADSEPCAASNRRLVCVARLSAQKGLGVLIEAARLLAPTHGFELSIIGGGEMQDEIARSIAHHGLSRHVRLLGWRSTQDVRDTLAKSRALVLPSFAEGLPVVLMEALALGRPVVATGIAGVPELVDHECGWIVPPASAERLAAAMAAALDASPARLREMGEAGRQRVRRSHDARANAAQLGRLLAGE